MTAISLRQRVYEATGMTDLSGGFWHSVVNPYYRQSLETRALYPYLYQTSKTKISIAATLEGFRMPTAFNTASYYPEDAGGEWSEECQGITASDTHWYLTNNEFNLGAPKTPRLSWVSFLGDLDTDLPIVELPSSLEGNYHHFGDPSYWKPQGSSREFVLVPCDHDEGSNVPDICVAFEITSSPTPTYHSHATVAAPPSPTFHLDGTAWCAVSPVKDVYYCSEFCETELVIYPFVPKLDNDIFILDWPEPSTTTGIRVRTKAGTPLQVYRVQVGAVSNRGHLYISSDVKKSQGGGIRLIEMASGTIQNFLLNMKFEHQSTNEGCSFDDTSQEYQGLCIKDMNPVHHHPNVSGQIHFVMTNNDLPNEDNVTIAHFTITDPNEKPWI